MWAAVVEKPYNYRGLKQSSAFFVHVKSIVVYVVCVCMCVQSSGTQAASGAIIFNPQLPRSLSDYYQLTAGGKKNMKNRKFLWEKARSTIYHFYPRSVDQNLITR
jgi:hypothetical protein